MATKLSSYIYLIFRPAFGLPKKELNGFERVNLKAGETKTLTFTITSEDYYIFDVNTDKYIVEPGNYTLRVGGFSDSLPLSATYNLINETLKPDLRIINVYSTSRYPVAVEKITFLATVKNFGTTATSSGTPLKVGFKVNDVDATWTVTNNKSIPAGGMFLIYANSGQDGINIWLASNNGTYTITAIADPDNAINEHNETNNSKTASLTVSDLPQPNYLFKQTRTLVGKFCRKGRIRRELCC